MKDGKRPEIPPNLWPHVLASAASAYRHRGIDGAYSSSSPLVDVCIPVDICIPQASAIYQLLVEGRGSFIDAVRDRNMRTSLPPEIGQLHNLMDLDFNDVGSLPPDIGQLQNLSHLDFNDVGSLESFPLEIGQL